MELKGYCWKEKNLFKRMAESRKWRRLRKVWTCGKQCKDGYQYGNLYAKLGTKEGEDGICKLPKVREKWKTGNFDHIRCVGDDDDRVLVKDEEFINKWEMYLYDLSTTKCAGRETDDVEPN